MKLFNDVRNYIGENQFKIIIYSNMVNIINYKNIDEINNNKISIISTKKIIISGQNLKIKKLENNEVLIIGIINNIKINE